MSGEFGEVLWFKEEIGDGVYSRDIQKDLAFSREDIDAAMMEHAELYAFYATLCANAKSHRDRLESIMEVQDAIIDEQIREEADAKLTETEIKKRILRHPQHIDALNAYHDACAIYNKLKAAVDAFENRKHMIISEGAMMRTEINSFMVVSDGGSADATRIRELIQ